MLHCFPALTRAARRAMMMTIAVGLPVVLAACQPGGGIPEAFKLKVEITMTKGSYTSKLRRADGSKFESTINPGDRLTVETDCRIVPAPGHTGLCEVFVPELGSWVRIYGPRKDSNGKMRLSCNCGMFASRASPFALTAYTHDVPKELRRIHDGATALITFNDLKDGVSGVFHQSRVNRTTHEYETLKEALFIMTATKL